MAILSLHLRPLTLVLVAILAAEILLLLAGCLLIGSPRYRGPASDHFDGRRFHNLVPTGRHGFGSLLRWHVTRDRGPWLAWVDNPPADAPPVRVGPGELRVTYVGHSTVLLQMDGLNILTDPLFSDRIGPVSWAGPRRHRPPGIPIEQLPPIDVVLVSHDHYDHMDLPALEQLARLHRPRILTSLGNAAMMGRRGIGRVEEMDWWEGKEIGDGVRVSFVPSQHFSSRGLCDHNCTLWGGFVIQGPAGVVYFASDTGLGPHLAEIRRRFGPPRLALLPIGAFRPRWFMAPMHLSPAEAVGVHQELGAGTSLAIHFGTLPLGDDGQFEPVEELFRALAANGVSPARFWALEPGQGRDVPPPGPSLAP